MFCVFDLKAYEILAPWPGIEPTSPALEAGSSPLDHQASFCVSFHFIKLSKEPALLSLVFTLSFAHFYFVFYFYFYFYFDFHSIFWI